MQWLRVLLVEVNLGISTLPIIMRRDSLPEVSPNLNLNPISSLMAPENGLDNDVLLSQHFVHMYVSLHPIYSSDQIMYSLTQDQTLSLSMLPPLGLSGRDSFLY